MAGSPSAAGMKTLWVNPNFLHPTTKGGQIRTLEMLRHLHRWHEIHYVAFENPGEPEGPRRAPGIFALKPIRFRIASRRGDRPAFLGQAAANLISSWPLPVSRYRSDPCGACSPNCYSSSASIMLSAISSSPPPTFPISNRAILFQHNVETMIWQRHADTRRRLRFASLLRLRKPSACTITSGGSAARSGHHRRIANRCRRHAPAL